MPDIEKIANILGAETVGKVYEDAASGAVKEVGKTATDIAKTFRLFTAPLQFTASLQDRLSRFFERTREKVPEERQIESPAMIAGPIIDRLKYLEDENHLTEMFINLLARSIDKERIREAHPAFIHIIEQLSPDEALILFELKDKIVKVKDVYVYNETRTKFKRVSRDIQFPMEKLAFPENFGMYYDHMHSLNLLKWPITDHEAVWDTSKIDTKVQTGTIDYSHIHITDFGSLFIKACIPEKGFIIVSKPNK